MTETTSGAVDTLVLWLEEELEFEINAGLTKKKDSPKRKTKSDTESDKCSSKSEENAGATLGQELLNLYWITNDIVTVHIDIGFELDVVGNA